jgi:hypothetical protein
MPNHRVHIFAFRLLRSLKWESKSRSEATPQRPLNQDAKIWLCTNYVTAGRAGPGRAYLLEKSGFPVKRVFATKGGNLEKG